MVILIACLGGAWLSGRALKPVNDIAAAAHMISIENLAERLPVPETGDELARLGDGGGRNVKDDREALAGV